MLKEVKVPKERLPVVIGKNGKIKKEIEDALSVRLEINEAVMIEGEPLSVMCAENVIKAIGRGFSAETSLNLLDESNVLVIIQFPGDKKQRKRLKARVIGESGSVKKRLEEVTNTYISVYGKTVSIIGSTKNVLLCQNAVEKLISGSSHRYVYHFLGNR